MEVFEMITSKLEELHHALMCATQGSNDLDKMVARVLEIRPGRYTRSLDARLPIENIIEMRQGQDSDGKPMFFAVHCREPDGVGVHFGSVGRTEAIARRVAVLLDHIEQGRTGTT